MIRIKGIMVVALAGLLSLGTVSGFLFVPQDAAAIKKRCRAKPESKITCPVPVADIMPAFHTFLCIV